MKCPLCKQHSLWKQELEVGLQAQSCKNCQGIWMPGLQYWEWVQTRSDKEREGLAAPEVALPVEETGRAKLCPECGHFLRRFKVWPNVKFYVDRCAGCNGMWFDPDEWVYLKSKGQEAQVHEFFGELWQEDIREEEARQWLEDMYLERFGTEDYDRIREIRRWLWEHPNQATLMAFLTDKDPYRI